MRQLQPAQQPSGRAELFPTPLVFSSEPPTQPSSKLPPEAGHLACLDKGSLGERQFPRHRIVTWLILPVVICLSQRLSHACLSISNLYSETANGSLNQLSFI